MACNMQRFIKVAQRKLGLDDDTYRSFLFSVTGKRSTTEMSPQERWRVVESLKAKGVRLDPVQRTAKGKKDAKQDDDGQSRLARHLWLLLKHYGVLQDSSEWALLAYVERITKRKRLEWCTHKQITKVIETLKKWVERIEKGIVADAIASGALPPEPVGPFRDMGDAMRRKAEWGAAREAYLDTYNPARKAA